MIWENPFGKLDKNNIDEQLKIYEVQNKAKSNKGKLFKKS